MITCDKCGCESHEGKTCWKVVRGTVITGRNFHCGCDKRLKCPKVEKQAERCPGCGREGGRACSPVRTTCGY